ncbi:MAG: tripartite tricarboxylate transporter substrate-binding protein [Chthoniobacteraceae bacterium]
MFSTGLTIDGGTVFLEGGTLSSVTLNADLELRATGFGFGGRLAGPISSSVPGTGVRFLSTGENLRIEGALDYSGVTKFGYGLEPGGSSIKGGTVTIRGIGRLTGTSAIYVDGAVLELESDFSQIDRLPDAAAVHLRGGELRHIGRVSPGTVVETIGDLMVAGSSIVTSEVFPGIAGIAAGELIREDRGTLFFRGTDLGSSSFGSRNNIRFTTPPTLVGGGGTGLLVSIIPYAVLGTLSFEVSGNNFVTYDPAGGVRPLNLNSEFITELTGDTTTANLNSPGFSAHGVPHTVNALRLSGTEMHGTAPITISSGIFLNTTSASVSVPLDFGSTEAIIFANGTTEISGVITGTNGLTTAGPGALRLSGSRPSFTGPLTINGGFVLFTDPARLGNNQEPIQFGGPGARLSYEGTSPVSLARDIHTLSGLAEIESTGGELTISGVISGAGGLRLTSTNRIVIAGANSYTGPTRLDGGRVQIASDSAFGIGGILESADGIFGRMNTIELAGPWTTARDIAFTDNLVLDTSTFSAQWDGVLLGDGALTKRGTGALHIPRESPFSGPIVVEGGTVRLSNGGALLSNMWTVRGGLLDFDNAATADSDRVNDTATLVLAGGEFRITGNATEPVRETVGPLSLPDEIQPGTVTLATAAGAAPVQLTLASLVSPSSTSTLLVRGDNLGGPGGTAVHTRWVSVIPPVAPALDRIVTTTTDMVAESKPDGYTILLNVPLIVQTASLFKKLPYDPLKDLTPVADLNHSQIWFAVGTAKVKAKTFQEYIAAARANPRDYSYASIGPGSTGHLLGFGLNEANKLDTIHVPYKGSTPALQALLSGEVASVFQDYVTLKPQVEAGKVRLLAVTGTERSEFTPDVPTLAELGYSGFEAGTWAGLFVAANTPPAIVKTLENAVHKITADPEYVEKMAALGYKPGHMSQAQFATLVRTEYTRWATLIRKVGITLD